MSKPQVVLVGRTNVGKSTLFNRLIQENKAIVDSSPGVTRDFLEGELTWRGKTFNLIDTGGFQQTDDLLQKRAIEEAFKIAEEADLILFVVDGREGLNVEDEKIADFLRKLNKPIILVVNKIDDFARKELLFDFYALGLGEPFPLSAIHGLNTGDLLDLVVESLAFAEEETQLEIPKIAIVGRPNVGKSSLVNYLVGRQRVIVTPVAGTTRDTIDTLAEIGGRPYLLLDTAGLRRKTRVNTSLEYYGYVRALRAIDKADIVILMLDATSPITSQDQRIAGQIKKKGKATVVLINKWDLVEEGSSLKWKEDLTEKMGFISYAPFIYTSALTGKGIKELSEVLLEIEEEGKKHIPTPELNNFLREVTFAVPPPAFKGRRGKIYYVYQKEGKPLTFIFFVNNPQLFPSSYERYLHNRLRQEYGFKGYPLIFFFRKR